MTQDMAGLKKNNSEKDQAWARPGLEDFDPQKDNLCFQQIECEEGTFDDGKTCVKLFGVTQANLPSSLMSYPLTICRLDIQRCCM